MRKLVMIGMALAFAFASFGCGDQGNPDPGKTMDEKRNDMTPQQAPGAGGNTPENTPKTEGM